MNAPQETQLAGCVKRQNGDKAMKKYVITQDGKIAWEWLYPENRVTLTDADEFARTHEIISDDRGKQGGNVWD
jgi:hypothetical protein